MNITFDLETLGNTSNAPIVQIGAVKFTDDGEITDKFLVNIDLKSLERIRDNFVIDFSTISWWFNQSDEAIKSVYGEELERMSLHQALYEFHQWIGKTEDYEYWSHATFDPPILHNNYKAIGRENPIPFRLHSDIRTLTRNVKKIGGNMEVERTGIAHNALDDCLTQADYISKGLQILNNLK